jgi:hypothetical protein
METTPCRIAIGDDADGILGRPAFPFFKQPVELDLVVLSVFELGFMTRTLVRVLSLGRVSWFRFA